jgi:hypothetical protein
MLTPTVTELPRRLEPATADAFIDVRVRRSLATSPPPMSRVPNATA